MALLNFLKPKNQLEEGGRTSAPVQRDAGEPEKNCPNCHKDIPLSRLWANGLVCSCGYHFRMKARQRIQLIADKGSFRELYSGMRSENPLNFPGYNDKIETVRIASAEKEAVVCGTAAIGAQKCCLFVMESYFMMGSMGSAVGEKITSLFEYAVQHRLPVIGFTVSGGARMQEGLLSLLQMAKTSAALEKLSNEGLPYISVLTNPTMGGVSASLAMLGDVNVAEPKALIGFAGPRVIEQTVREKLPEGFQRSEFLLTKGVLDGIIDRREMRDKLACLIGKFMNLEPTEQE